MCLERQKTHDCCTADKLTTEFDIRKIKAHVTVRDMLSDMLEWPRDAKRMAGREYMFDNDDGDDFGGAHIFELLQNAAAHRPSISPSFVSDKAGTLSIYRPENTQ